MKRIIIGFAVLTLGASSSQAQQPTPESEVLGRCVSLAGRGKADSAAAVGKTAEPIYRKRIAKNPRDVDALVGTARVLSQCLLPATDFMSQGELSQEAMDLLGLALEIQPTNWMARFSLASIAYRSPAFVGRGPIATKHLDELLRQQGNRSNEPMFARVYEMRGMQLMRDGKADDARALWNQGLRLFPGDTALAALIARNPAKPDKPAQEIATLSAMRIVATAAAPPEVPLPAVRELPRSQILMTAGGGADILQAVRMQPGATMVTEGSDVYTRGGDPGETATILNGSRLLSLSRFEGLNGGMFGGLEPYVVKSVKYATGGFSARNGNALSGIIDIETDGRPRERKMRAGLSLVQASGTAWLPANRKVGGWVSARASQTAALLATHGRTGEFDGAPHSEEIIGSVIANPSSATELRATAMVVNDDSRRIVDAAGYRGAFHSAGDTRALMVASKWRASSAPLSVSTNVIGSSRSSLWQFGVLSRDRDDRSLIGRADAEWEANEGVILRAGMENGAFDRRDRGSLPTSPSVAEGAPMRELSADVSSTGHRGAYSEAELVRGSSSLVVGLRGDRLPGEADVTFDPRLALSTRRGEWTARLSGGLFHQGRWRADAPIPNAGTPSGTPGEARHLIAGLENESRLGVLRAEAFVKSYSDYSEFGSGPQIISTDARGVDLLAQRRTGAVTGWAGYSFIDARSTLVDRRRVSSPFDITHSVTGSVTAALASDWSVGSTARYGTGAPITPIIGSTTTSDGFPIPAYGALNSERLPGYGRLDARVMRFIRTPGALVTSFVEMINVTNRHNVSGMTYDARYRERMPTHSFFASRTIVVGGEVQFR